MAKKKSGSKKKKNNKLKSKASVDGDDSADELDHSQDLISGKLDFEDITLPPEWLKAHQVIGIDHLAIIKSETPAEAQTGSENEKELIEKETDRRRKTENHARRIYTDLFYIHFANEFSIAPNALQDAEWAITIFKRSMDKSFKTVQDLVRQSGFQLGLCRSTIDANANTDTETPSADDASNPITETTLISSLLTEKQIRFEVPFFVASLKPGLADPSTTTSTALAPGPAPSSLFDTLNTAVEAQNMLNPLKYSKDIQAVRQLLRYLNPHEAKEFLSEVVAHLMNSTQAETKRDSFEMVKMMRSCLSKSPARELLAEIEYNRITEPAADKTKHQGDTAPALLDTGYYLSALQLADDLELWHRIHLLKAKNDVVLKLCLENSVDHMDALHSHPSS